MKTILISFLSTFMISALAAQGLQMKEVMEPSEFRAAGLAKLSPAELKALDGWLNRFYAKVLSRYEIPATTENSPTTTHSSSAIETRIDGEFEGWDGETIFRLMNGQIWQQASYAYTYHYAYMPRVIIFRSGSRYKMKVEGVRGEIYVERIK